QKMKEKRKMQENFLFCVGMPAVAGDMARDEMEKKFCVFQKSLLHFGKKFSILLQEEMEGKEMALRLSEREVSCSGISVSVFVGR
ncbi:MAG: hypothetical protein IJC58_00505, partial [Oscillospiraceae bacterium]|nr:hypothetical protein [Oscillospiraceae bacterium]